MFKHQGGYLSRTAIVWCGSIANFAAGIMLSKLLELWRYVVPE